MDLSIVIPVYNVSEYIEECLNSVLEITGISYEVIVIDDGSTDNSLEKIAQICEQQDHVRIISRENKGLSVTRNEGLKLSHGEYVYFMDSDDWIDADKLVTLFKRGNENLADVIIGNVYQFDAKGVEKYPNAIPCDVAVTGKQVLTDYYLKCCSSVVWRSIYRKDFLLKNNLFFLEGVYFEDIEWTPRVLYYSNKVFLSSCYFYYYRMRAGSICLSNFSEKKLIDSIVVLNAMINFNEKYLLNNKGIEKIYNKIILSFLFQSIVRAYNSNITVENSLINKMLVKIKPIGLMHSAIYLMYKILPKRAFIFLYNKLK